MTISSPGIGSNLDVNGIVAKLMAVESQPLTLMQKREASFQAKLSAYGTLKGALASFQTSVSALNSVSKFQSMTATSSDTTVLSASATSLATPGNYSVTVSALAQAQTISSAAQTSTSAAIGAGTSTTLTFQFGTISGGTLTSGIYSGSNFTQDATQATGTVVIDSTNNSLQGIRDAINAAKVGVTASIVSDGNPTSPYHLLLTSNNSGLAKSMKITSSAGDASITSLLAYDPAATQNLTQTSVAQNAALTVNGLAISSASNAVIGAISGATLNLIKAGTSNLIFANDTASVVSAVQALVTSYNTTNASLNSLTRVNPSTKQAGILVGDSPTQLIQARMRSTLSTALSGLGSNTLTNISQIGVTFLKDGTLSLDSAKLQAALAANPGEFAQLFTAFGKPTDSLVSYVSASGNAKPGSYAVSVTSLATQGKTVGSDKATQARQTGNTAAGLSITTASNDTLTLSVDGAAAVTATLAQGLPYGSPALLATEVQTKINAALTAAGQTGSVTVTESGGILRIDSNKFGAASSIGTITGNGAANLLGAAPTNSTIAKITTGVNDQLTLAVNGTSATVTLAAGTYTASTLANQIQSAVNGTSAFSTAGITVNVAQAADVLTVTADRYGSTSTVNVSSGSAITNLFGAAPTATAGIDIAGTINGVTATGSGQSLTAATGLQGKSVGSDKGTQALRAGSAAAGLTITAGTNNTLTLAVDGAAAVTATLTANTYTAATLATEVQTQINAALTAAGQAGQVTVTQSGGIFSISSNKFGAASSVGAVTGNGATNLLGATQSNSTISTITAGVNDQLTLSLDGTSGTVTLAAGTYTATTLATQIQSAINSASAFTAAGKLVTVTQAADVFTLTSNGSGTSSTVSITGGSARTNLLGATQAETTGNATSNVAGDIKLQVIGGTTGARGTVNFSQGYAYNLNTLMNSMLSGSGPLASSTDGINKNIADLQKRAAVLNIQLTATEKRYRAQFMSLDLLIGKLSTTSSFLAQQLANLPKIE